MVEFYAALADVLLRLVVAGIGALTTVVVLPWIKNDLIPWLHEKRIYALVTKFVHAAEKLYEAGNLNGLKKEYVIALLIRKGISVTPEVDTFIESAVKELDIAIDSSIDEIVGEFIEEETIPFADAAEMLNMNEQVAGEEVGADEI